MARELKDYLVMGAVFLGVFVFVVSILQSYGIAEKLKVGILFPLLGIAIAVWTTFTLLQRRLSLGKLDVFISFIAYAVAVVLIFFAKTILPNSLFATLLP